MSLKNKDSTKKYQPVELEQLTANMLVERSLYIHLAENDRYVQMARPLWPLENRVLSKLIAIGRVYTDAPSIEQRYPLLTDSVKIIKKICSSDDEIPFHKAKIIIESTRWLSKIVFDPSSFQSSSHWHAVLFFVFRSFGEPKLETLSFVSDLSVEMYEQSLKLASYCGILALWLGYSDSNFLSQFINTVFCEQIGVYLDSTSESLVPDEALKNSSTLIQRGKVPGVHKIDLRFEALLSNRQSMYGAGDEIVSVLDYARSLVGLSQSHIESSRIYRKLKFVFEDESDELSAADKERAA